MRPVATALVCLALLVGATAGVRADCPPAAVPIGDPALVSSVAERLSASGIATTPREGCPVVRVNVEQRGPQLHLRVVDAYQRHGERDVQDVATAAAVIESWTLQAIDPGSLPPAVETPAAAVAIASPAPATRTWIGAGGRSLLGDDGSTWLGGNVHGCMRMRWACVGGSASVATATSAVEDMLTGPHRSLAVDALATADVPRRLGRFTASAGIALGYGWNRIEEQHLDMHMLPFAISHASHALVTGAHLVISRRLGGGVALFGELFGDVALLRTAIPDGPRARGGLALGARFEAP